VSAAVALEMDGDRIAEARVALGGVAHKPWRVPEAEAVLRGQKADETAFARAADLLVHDAKGYSHNEFKIELARRTAIRTLKQAANGTPQVQSNKKIV
jgi:xanthine dehydrogenase YagS FAD-binding subunit